MLANTEVVPVLLIKFFNIILVIVMSANAIIDKTFEEMISRDGSDLYLSVGSLPGIRLSDKIIGVGAADPLTAVDTREIALFFLNARQMTIFENNLEYNLSYNFRNKARFRINFFFQQGSISIVARRINNLVHTFDNLGLPPIYGELVLKPRGLVLLVGPTGSGKSSSASAMVNYRNMHGSGHIITIEEPIEYLHKSCNCIITQREVGVDTISYKEALKNAVRQRADVIVVGEIRDRESMEHAMHFASSGHLCIATLGANNAYQSIQRVLNFFPEDAHNHVLFNLSQNLEAILAQKLIPKKDSEIRILAIEILINNGYIKRLIEEKRLNEIRDYMERHNDMGMCLMDQALCKLYDKGDITKEALLVEATDMAQVQLFLMRKEGDLEKEARDKKNPKSENIF
jgi:twitching motility protein PilU